MTDKPQDFTEFAQTWFAKLEANQTAWLAKLETDNNQIQANLNSIFPEGRPTALTSQQIASLIDYVQRCENYFRSYETTALDLKWRGFPRLYERVEQILADLRGAEKVYKDMLQGVVDAERARSQIAKGLSDQWLTTMQGVMERRRRLLTPNKNDGLRILRAHASTAGTPSEINITISRFVRSAAVCCTLKRGKEKCRRTKATQAVRDWKGRGRDRLSGWYCL